MGDDPEVDRALVDSVSKLGYSFGVPLADWGCAQLPSHPHALRNSLGNIYVLEKSALVVSNTFVDLGAGCCGGRVAASLFVGAVGDVEFCEQKCLHDADCGFIDHGWKDSLRTACRLLSTSETCASLNSCPGDCGSNEDDFGHWSGTLSGAAQNDDDTHGLGNELGADTRAGQGSSKWWHDVANLQGDSHGGNVIIQGVDHGTQLRDHPLLGQYAVFVSQAKDQFPCEGGFQLPIPGVAQG